MLQGDIVPNRHALPLKLSAERLQQHCSSLWEPRQGGRTDAGRAEAHSLGNCAALCGVWNGF